MSLLSGIVGLIKGNPAGPLATQNINAENGVVAATGAGQAGVQNAINQNDTNVNNVVGSASNDVNNTVANATNNVNQAGFDVTSAAKGANGSLQSMLDKFNANTSAGVASGTQGNEALQKYATSNPQFNFAPTQEQLENTPGYKFQLQQGTNAITNSASAQGLTQGGGTLAALTQYGQGLAGTYYQNAFNNAKSQFDTNQNATLNNLNSLIASGNTANTQQLGAASVLGAPQAQNTVNAANTNASLQQYLAGLQSNTGLGLADLQTGAATTLAGQRLQGNEYGAGLGLAGAKTAGDFAVGAGAAQTAGNVANGNNISQIGSGLASLLTGFGGG